MTRCTCHDTLVVKNLNRWFKEKWVDVSRKNKDGKHPPCGRSKAKLSGKGYPKCRPSVKVSSKTPKTSGSMSSGQKQAATKRKRAKKQGVGGKPTIVKTDYTMRSDMDAFTEAWNVLKSNTLPIRPKVMQYATDQKKTMRLEQPGGVARRGRERMMDERRAEMEQEKHRLPSRFETDIMDQFGYRGSDRTEERDAGRSGYEVHNRDIYDRRYLDKFYGRNDPSYNYVEALREIKPELFASDKFNFTPEENADRAMMRARGQSFLDDIGAGNNE